MSYDTWKCSPPDEEFETEACGHIVGTCVCDEAPVEEDGGIVAEVEMTLEDIASLENDCAEALDVDVGGNGLLTVDARSQLNLLTLARKALEQEAKPVLLNASVPPNAHLHCGQCRGVSSHKMSCSWRQLPLEGELLARLEQEATVERRLGVGPQAWLRNSLVARAQELRKMERRCIEAHTKGEMRVAAERLSGTYAKAAHAFDDAVLMYCEEDSDG